MGSTPSKIKLEDSSESIDKKYIKSEVFADSPDTTSLPTQPTIKKELKENIKEKIKEEIRENVKDEIKKEFKEENKEEHKGEHKEEYFDEDFNDEFTTPNEHESTYNEFVPMESGVPSDAVPIGDLPPFTKEFLDAHNAETDGMFAMLNCAYIGWDTDLSPGDGQSLRQVRQEKQVKDEKEEEEIQIKEEAEEVKQEAKQDVKIKQEVKQEASEEWARLQTRVVGEGKGTENFLP